MKCRLSVLVGPGIPTYLKDCFPEGTVLTAGDTTISWHSDRSDEVDAARATFEKLTAKGYTAFRSGGKEGQKGEKLKTFDPEAERIILVPRIAGGC
jgi:hypothetical protein